MTNSKEEAKNSDILDETNGTSTTERMSGASNVVHGFLDVAISCKDSTMNDPTVIHDFLDMVHSSRGTKEHQEREAVEKAFEVFVNEEVGTEKDKETLKMEFVLRFSNKLCEREGYGCVKEEYRMPMEEAGFKAVIVRKKKKVMENYNKARKRLNSDVQKPTQDKMKELLERMTNRGTGVRSAKKNYDDTIMLAKFCKKQLKGYAAPTDEEIWLELIRFEKGEGKSKEPGTPGTYSKKKFRNGGAVSSPSEISDIDVSSLDGNEDEGLDNDGKDEEDSSDDSENRGKVSSESSVIPESAAKKVEEKKSGKRSNESPLSPEVKSKKQRREEH